MGLDDAKVNVHRVMPPGGNAGLSGQCRRQATPNSEARTPAAARAVVRGNYRRTTLPAKTPNRVEPPRVPPLAQSAAIDFWTSADSSLAAVKSGVRRFLVTANDTPVSVSP